MGAVCKLRKIFTLKSPPLVATEADPASFGLGGLGFGGLNGGGAVTPAVPGVRLVTHGPYTALSSIEPCFECKTT
jgi:hypothetical protein